MTRVRIQADTHAQERAIAELLAEIEGIELVDAAAEFADVLVVIGQPRRIPPGPTVVVLSARDAVGFDSQIRAWLPLSATAEELSAAIVAAAQDLTVLTREQARRRLPDATRLSADENGFVSEELTNREQQ